MSVKKFKFVSPGIFINEIDNSQLTKLGDEIGPVIIGRTLRGPAMRPTRIESFSDFVETFGEPVAGGIGGDVWRDGNRLGPTYAAYAAQAYLRNASPITFVRLLGESHPEASSRGVYAGWTVPAQSKQTYDAATGAPGAYGLFVANGPGEGKKAYGEITIDGVLPAHAGFAATTIGGVAAAAQENSAGHQASTQVMVAQTGAGEYSNGVGGIQSLTVTNIGGDSSDVGKRVYTISDDNDALGATYEVANGGEAAAAIATGLAARINEIDGDVLEARADGAKIILRNKKRGLFANVLNVVSAGGSLAAATNGRQTSCFQAATAMTDIAGPVVADAEISIAAACESAGILPSALSAENHAVDLALGAQFAAALNGDTASIAPKAWIATSAGAADGGSVVVKIQHPDAGVNTAVLAGPFGVASLSKTDVGSGDGAGTAQDNTMDAALAAIIYVKAGSVALVGDAVGGTAAGDGKTVDGINCWVKSDGANSQFKLRARHGLNASANAGDAKSNREDIAFSFDKNSRMYIRNVLNTNPTLCNGTLTEGAAKKAYFLAETYDRHLADVQSAIGSAGTGAGKQYAALIPLASEAVDHEADSQAAQSPWVISQHNGEPSNFDTSRTQLLEGSETIEDAGVEKLFRFHSLYSGEWERKNLKVSIYDIKAPTDKFNPYGSFSVMVRKSEDSDSAPMVVERFSSCNLNPASPDFIARKIGDMDTKWDEEERRYIQHGLFENQSRFIRVELAESVEGGSADPRFLPFGFLGPRKRSDIVFTTDSSSVPQTLAASKASATEANILDQVNFSGVRFDSTEAEIADGATARVVDSRLFMGTADDAATQSVSITMKFPSLALRSSTADSSLSNPRQAYFGVTNVERGTTSVHDASWGDACGFVSYGVDNGTDPAAPGTDDVLQFIFTLDDIKLKAQEVNEGATVVDPNRLKEGKPKNYEWVAGSHARSYASGGAAGAAGTDATACSLTAYRGFTDGTGVSFDDAPRERSFEAVLNAGIDSFTLPLVGGHDGLDIFEIQPFGYHANSASESLAETGDSALDHYALNTVKKAIDTCADPEVVEMNMMVAPGMCHPAITNHMVQVCENRGDALAIIDINYDYMPAGLDRSKDSVARMPHVDNAIKDIRERGINSSYACTFFPWVQIRDSQSGRVLWAPPSIAALGTMASSTRRSELWFAPAGFTRGGLTDGAAGIGVSNVRLRLNSKERDKLYEANVNPIAQFPAEGIVIFGQKTLQLTPSALDRINVRRLMIFLKKQISRMAKTVLFDQNVKTTWARFVSKADPFLASVKGRFGLTEYKIILDESTTTSELIDRNIMYAKIMLKPARAIEYIAIDFVITDSGASFDD